MQQFELFIEMFFWFQQKAISVKQLCGMYWRGEKEQDTAKIGMQAESADYEGAKVSNFGSGFHGSGMLDFKGKEGKVRWYQENDGSEGMFTLRFR